MGTWITRLQFLIILSFPLFSKFVSLETKKSNTSAVDFNLKCIEIEREALLKFREGLIDPSGHLASWVGKDCCRWKGVHCNNQTRNVVKLNLRNQGDYLMERTAYAPVYKTNSSCLGGKISPSLVDLKHLRYLDLSMNDFQGIQIPEFFGSLVKLHYLNLSYACFSGIVPHLGNLSNLQYLDLFAYQNSYRFIGNSLVSDLNWISRLTSLKYLNLGYVDLSLATTHWLQDLNMLPSLSELHLYNCGLQNLPPSLPNLNFTSLSNLDLSYNYFNTLFPQWLFNISSLVELRLEYCNLKALISQVGWQEFRNFQALDLAYNYIGGDISDLVGALSRCSNSTLEMLDLRNNQLSGQLPDSLGHLKNLKSLVLDENIITGPIPASIGRLSKLKRLRLSYNTLSGAIQEYVRELGDLVTLELYQNSWEGVLSQTHLKGLKKLKYFSISSSNRSFVINVSDEWIPPFSLTFIRITNCPMGPKFPAWLETQKQLYEIILADVAISDTIPDWLKKQCPQIQLLDLSDNQIGGMIPYSLEFSQETVIVNLAFNRFTGQVPLWPQVTHLILAGNLLSGSIPIHIGHVMPHVKILDLSRNILNGTIPSSISEMNYLQGLDVSHNHLSGKIHIKWRNLLELRTIDLSRNNLSGNIPSSICSLSKLFWLRLSSNGLSGELLTLQNCTHLTALDLGENKFSGNISRWIGENNPSLQILRLRDNLFYGSIPEQLCHISNLHILDLAINNLSGSIPSCLGNITGLSSPIPYSPYSGYSYLNYVFTPKMEVVVKGRPLNYTDTLSLVSVIDLSSNNFHGYIPEEFTNLSSLRTLNLSRNQLTGKIPDNIGGLKQLESLDLSSNHLSGPIPPSMSSITSLNYLNLSYNNLSGQIPSTNQFQTFNDPSIYEGNPALCGRPLSTNCLARSNDHKVEDGDANDDEDEDEDEMLWFYLSMVLGFVVGFWAVFGSLVIKRSWRRAYFGFLDKVRDWLFNFVVQNKVSLQRIMKRERN